MQKKALIVTLFAAVIFGLAEALTHNTINILALRLEAFFIFLCLILMFRWPNMASYVLLVLSFAVALEGVSLFVQQNPHTQNLPSKIIQTFVPPTSANSYPNVLPTNMLSPTPANNKHQLSPYDSDKLSSSVAVTVPIPPTVTPTPAPPPSTPDSEDNQQPLFYADGKISSNSVITVPVRIEDVPDLQIYIAPVTDTLSLQARLETSAGKVVAPDQKVPIIFDASRSPIPPGDYNIILTSGTLTTTTDYVVSVQGTSDLLLGVSLRPPTVGLASSGIVTAELAVGTYTASTIFTGSAQVTAAVSLIDSNLQIVSTTNVPLVDDGIGVDEVAGDGIYSAYTPDISSFRGLIVSVTATGLFRGKPFTRYNTAFDGARGGGIAFNNTYSWATFSKGTPATSDIDTINFNVGVTVQQPGNYRFTTGLYLKSGSNTIEQTVNLPAGTSTVTLSFDGFELYNTHQDGPYRIGSLDIALVGSEDSYEAAQLDDLSPLPILDLTRDQLHRLPFEFKGLTADGTADPAANGKFQSLAVTVTLDVAFTGTYSVGVALRTPHGDVTSVIGQVTMGASHQTLLVLYFSPKIILETKENGPYTVTDLFIQDIKTQKALLYVGTVGQTRNYLYSEFTNRE